MHDLPEQKEQAMSFCMMKETASVGQAVGKKGFRDAMKACAQDTWARRENHKEISDVLLSVGCHFFAD